jgi:hypothetical protein
MFEVEAGGRGTLVRAIDAAHARVGAAQRELLRLVVEVDRCEAWRDDGARDLAHWLSMRYGISAWKAHRWIGAARALESLPRTSRALATGELGIDKVLEPARFATLETEADLVRWAEGVSCGAIRHKGDLAARASREQTEEVERGRFLEWWYCDDGRCLALSGELPAAQGAVVARAIERLSETIPVMPDEEDRSFSSARRADALVALCSARLAADPDPDRATVVVHAQLEGLSRGTGGCELQDGPVIAPETARRLGCSARVQTVLEDDRGEVVALGRMQREPPAWMLRQVRHRDRGCVFPGCGTRAFTEAHHVRWWRHGGRTELGNLALICSFHHRLVHEHGWGLTRDPVGEVGWFRPDGTRYRAGPSPGVEARPEPDERAVAVS